MPALRLSYLLSPAQLVETFERVASAFPQGVPTSHQAAIADFMELGHFATHLRRMRKIYAERFQVLRAAAARRLASLLELVPTETGLHTIGLLSPEISASEMTHRADLR